MSSSETITSPSPSPTPIPDPATSRNWAVAGHLSAFTVFLGVPIPALGPLVVWLVKRGEDPYAEWHAREALNFNLSVMLYTIASAVLILALVGIILLPAVLISWFVLVIVGAVKASNTEYYRYPMTIRFVN
jgi:uncharacterized Tic20 family protein